MNYIHLSVARILFSTSSYHDYTARRSDASTHTHTQSPANPISHFFFFSSKRQLYVRRSLMDVCARHSGDWWCRGDCCDSFALNNGETMRRWMPFFRFSIFLRTHLARNNFARHIQFADGRFVLIFIIICVAQLHPIEIEDVTLIASLWHSIAFALFENENENKNNQLKMKQISIVSMWLDVVDDCTRSRVWVLGILVERHALSARPYCLRLESINSF